VDGLGSARLRRCVRNGRFAWDPVAEDAGSDEQHHFLDRVEYHRIIEEVLQRVHTRDDIVIVGRGGATMPLNMAAPATIWPLANTGSIDPS